MLWTLRRWMYRVTLADAAFGFLFDTPPADEVVVVDCETTGLNPRRDELVEVAAIRVRRGVIEASDAFRALVRTDRAPSEASIKVHRIRARDAAEGREMHRVIPDLMRFIGPRPIVGYYVDFDVAMLDRYVLPFIEARLPNRRIDISSLYYALKYRDAPPGAVHDLRFATILADLGLPVLDQHTAFDDALMTAMAYLQLRDMERRGARLERELPRREIAPFGA